MRRRGWTGQVVNLIHFDVEGSYNVVVNELKIFVAQPMLHVPFPPREKIIHDDYFVASQHQFVNQMRSDKSSSSGNLLVTNCY